jgi:hypothetical protein
MLTQLLESWQAGCEARKHRLRRIFRVAYEQVMQTAGDTAFSCASLNLR